MDKEFTYLEPLVSVIIPNYNYGHFLQESIDSVLNQSYKNIEVIVVDDGSTDNSTKIIEAYSQRVMLISQENSGVSAARNHGMRFAKGDFVCFLDADDSWEPNKISSQISKFNDLEIGVVYSSINICDEELNHLEIVSARYKGDVEYLYYRFPTTAIILLGCSTAMIRAEVANSVGEFDTSLHTSADWDYFRRLSRLTEIDFVEFPIVNYRKHPSSMSAGSLEKYYRDNELAVRKQLLDSFANPETQVRSSILKLTWVRFQLGAAKAHLRSGLFKGAISHLFKIFVRYSK